MTLIGRTEEDVNRCFSLTSVDYICKEVTDGLVGEEDAVVQRRFQQ
jgi:hypothetical protein